MDKTTHHTKGNYYSFYSICCKLIFIEACITTVCGTCTFPSNLTGQWSRSRDLKALTFASSQVTGFNIAYFATFLDAFTCDFVNGNTYVISAPYTNLAAANRTFYSCWYLEEITSSAFNLYELSADIVESGFTTGTPGVSEAVETSVSEGTVCTKSISSTLFTTLIKDGASSSDVSSQCPTSLFATYSYQHCSSQSKLDFCTDRITATVDYNLCATSVLNTVGGALSCMGHVVQSSYTYVNLYNHDVGGGITCLRIPVTSGVAGTAIYYSGDCTTSSESGTTLTLTVTTTCPIETVTVSVSGNVTGGGEGEEESSSSSSSSVGIIAGIVVGAVIGGAALVAAVAFYCINKQGSKVNPDDKFSEAESGRRGANGVHVISTAPAITTSAFSFPEAPDSTHRLPPIETGSNVEVTFGEPLPPIERQ